MNKVLGLDIGTNSVGWALINLNEDNFTGSIIDMGARVIPSGGDQLAYFKQGKALSPEKGQSVSECAKRRSYRSARRNNFRFKMRRDKLLMVLDILGWNPIDIDFNIDHTGKYPKVVVLPKQRAEIKKEKHGYAFEETEIFQKYERRYRAVHGTLLPQEFGSVLYQLNQRRGYQDIGLLGQEEEENTKGKADRELKANQKKAVLTIQDAAIIEWTKPKKAGKKGKPVFSVQAHFEDGSTFIGTTKLGYFDKRKGKKIEVILEQDKEKSWFIVSVATKTGWSKSREENNQSLNGKMVGEKLFEYLIELRDGGYKHWEGTLRRRIYDRIFYKKEFDAIWEQQKNIIENISEEKVVAIVKMLAPNNEAKQKELTSKGLKWILKEYIIYYQRPLKGGKRKEARDCPFEPSAEVENRINGKTIQISKKAAPISHPSFQEYRIWQKIDDLKIFNKEKEQQFLAEGDYEKLYRLFSKKEVISQDDILKELFGKQKVGFHTNFPAETEFKGNVTLVRIKKAIASEAKEKQEWILNTPYVLNQLWHIIQTVKIKEARKKAFTQSSFRYKEANGGTVSFSFNITNEKSQQNLCELEFEKGYGSLSVKAIQKILPLMKRAAYFKPNEIDSQTAEKIKTFIDQSTLPAIGPKLFNKISEYKDFYDFQGFRYDEAAELVYGQHTRAKQEAEYKRPEDIRFIQPTELRHPVVEELVNECLKVVRDLWASKDHGKPQVIKIELAREFKNNEKRRKEIYTRQQNERKRNEEAANALRGDQFNIPYPTLSQIERWKLWDDQRNHVSGQSRCVYTGTYISPADLFYTTGNGSDNKPKYKFQVDHIIPKRRVHDDSYMNKVLVLGEANEAKDKFTAREFMEGGKSKSGQVFSSRLRWDEYVEFVNIFPAPKRDRLLMKTEELSEDFIERQKKETQYITRRVILELSKIVGSENVQTTTGGVTNFLKQEWGLTDIFKRQLKERYQTFENKINDDVTAKENQVHVTYIDKDENGRLRIKDFSKRIDHRHHALDALSVACTTRRHVKYLNDKNQLWQKYADDERQRAKYEKYKAENLSFISFISKLFEHSENGKQKFRKPWENFCTEVIEKLSTVVVSYKQKKFYHVDTLNRFRGRDNEGNIVVKQQKTFSIKGSLHNDQPNGLRTVFTGKYLSFKKLFDELDKRAPEQWTSYLYNRFPKSIAHQLKILLKSEGNDLKKAKQLLEQAPLTDRFKKPLAELPIIEQRIASRVPLIGLTEKDWKTIPSQQLKDELKEHYENNDFSSWEEAFIADGVAIFNDNRVINGKMRIDKVTVLQTAPFSTDADSANEIIERKNSFNRKAVFKKVGSSFTVMYEGPKGRKFKQVKLLDYARCIQPDGSVDFVEKMEGYNYFVLLDTHSFFYMPDEGEDGYATLKENKKEELPKKLYRLSRFSGKEVYFLPHTTTEPLAFAFHDQSRKKEVVINEYGSNTTKESEYATGSRRMIKKFGIPVTVDRLGNVMPIAQISFADCQGFVMPIPKKNPENTTSVS